MLITDMLVSFACVWGASNIIRNTKSKNLLKTYWILFFALCSVSFFTSAIGHALKSVFLSVVSWIFALGGVTCFAVGIASINIRIKLWHMILLGLYTLINMILVVVGADFIWVVIFCFVIMFLTILINRFTKIISFKHAYSKGILLGTGLFILSSLLYVAFRDAIKFDIRILSHILIAIGVLMFGESCKNTILQLEHAY